MTSKDPRQIPLSESDLIRFWKDIDKEEIAQNQSLLEAIEECRGGESVSAKQGDFRDLVGFTYPYLDMLLEWLCIDTSGHEGRTIGVVKKEHAIKTFAALSKLAQELSE
ncbi:hypothetical protein N9137_00955 [Pseudomonadales bacterium]|nr:hypothetical protein [Pseudomonadales bacterium]